jgi:hypothetical protein
LGVGSAGLTTPDAALLRPDRCKRAPEVSLETAPRPMAAVYKSGYYHKYAEVCALMEMWAEKYPQYTELESVRTRSHAFRAGRSRLAVVASRRSGSAAADASLS